MLERAYACCPSTRAAGSRALRWTEPRAGLKAATVSGVGTWVPTQSRHSRCGGTKLEAPVVVTASRDIARAGAPCQPRDGLVDDVPHPTPGFAWTESIGQHHRCAAAWWISTRWSPSPLCQSARTISSWKVPRARGQSGFVHPGHQCDCKHGLYRPSLLVRCGRPRTAPQG